MVKRILLVMTQPPGSSGVMGLIYKKILPFLEDEGWEFHFAGPSPAGSSVLLEAIDCPPSRLHYTESISWSRRFSVLKNRQSKGFPFRYIYSVFQAFAVTLERLFRHDSKAYLLAGVRRVIIDADTRWDFDLIGAVSPEFAILDQVAQVADVLQKSLLALVIDPHGKRDGDLFWPYDEQRQAQILRQSVGAMFMSPMTRDRYVRAGLVSDSKAYSFTDSYPTDSHLYVKGQSELGTLSHAQAGPDSSIRPIHALHLGMLPEWRPIEPLLAALKGLSPVMEIDFYGYVYPEAQKAISSDPILRHLLRCRQPVSHDESHYLAEDCDLLLVVIGPRHLDNQPSKFFDYLYHQKPFLVLGPRGNPIERLVAELGVGMYADVASRDSIESAMGDICTNYNRFVAAYSNNRDSIAKYSDRSVAKAWCAILDKVLLDSRWR